MRGFVFELFGRFLGIGVEFEEVAVEISDDVRGI